MKRIITIIMTLAVVAACTKTEIRYDQPDQISFAPVAKVSTKAAVDPTIGYPTTLPLFVFANAGDANADVSTYTTSYFDNFKFTYSTNAFVNANAYWPNEKYLVFAGVSASGNIGAQASAATLSMDFANNKLTVSGYTQPMATTGNTTLNNDLMWFPRTQAYGKQSSAIQPEMQHACALLTFKFIAESEIADWNIKIKSITVEDLYSSGTAICGAESATWSTTGANNSNIPVYSRPDETDNTTDDEKAVYTVKEDDNNSQTEDYIVPENVTDNTIVIPQVPTTLTVVYDFTTPAGQPLTETVSVPLTLGNEKNADGSDKTDAQGNKIPVKWQSGKRYTYNITMGADQIKIAPTVAAWGNETVPNNN